jgi:hypothetical protein
MRGDTPSFQSRGSYVGTLPHVNVFFDFPVTGSYAATVTSSVTRQSGLKR